MTMRLSCVVSEIFNSSWNNGVPLKSGFIVIQSSCKVLTTAQPSYLHNVISLQPPRSTRSSSVVTLSRRQPSPPWKSQIAHLDMHHLVFGIKFQIHSVSLTIRLDSPPHPLLNSSLSSSPLIHHSFSLSLQAQNLPLQQILPTVDFFYLLDCLTITGLDRTYYAHHFIFSFTFYFFCLFRVVD